MNSYEPDTGTCVVKVLVNDAKVNIIIENLKGELNYGILDNLASLNHDVY